MGQPLAVANLIVEIVTAKEVAFMLKVSVRQIQILASDRTLPGFRVGKQWRFRTPDVVGWLEAQAQGIAHRPSSIEVDEKYERQLNRKFG